MKIGDRVRWLGAKTESGWADEGYGEIVDYQPQRPYFDGGGPQEDGGRRGPAVCVRLDGRFGWCVWAPPDDIMPDLRAAGELPS